MISKALPQEKKIVYGIWKQVFAGDDGGYTDYFFRTLYKPENTLVLKESGNIVSTLMRIPHSIMLAGHILETSMILGVATIPSYRKRGCMHEPVSYTHLEKASQVKTELSNFRLFFSKL